MAKVQLKTPLATASGKILGLKSHTSLCTRKATGRVYTYHWPLNYLYPIIPARQRAAHRLGQASSLYRLVCEQSDSKLLKQFQKDFKAYQHRCIRRAFHVAEPDSTGTSTRSNRSQGKAYTSLRYFIIGYYTDQLKSTSYDTLCTSITSPQTSNTSTTSLTSNTSQTSPATPAHTTKEATPLGIASSLSYSV